MKLPAFPLIARNAAVAELIRDGYTADQLGRLERLLTPALKLSLTPHGFLKAAERPGAAPGGAPPTHYDAVWVRDSIWGYYGLLASAGAAPDGAPRKLLLALLDYMSSPEQLARARAVIANPKLIAGPRGAMNVLHIRFDAAHAERTGVLRDVFVGGKPQYWNHKQNDALALFLKATLDAFTEGLLSLGDLKPAHAALLALFPSYFDAIDYANMEDAGAWEEIVKVNSSSVGMVVAALEAFETAPAPLLSRLGIDRDAMNRFIERGYERLARQLARGESPLYPETNPRHRVSDANLLSLIYPARPKRLSAPDLARILELVEPLVGEIGIRRYLGDTYQCAGYWQRGSAAECTDDYSSEEAFLGRRRGFRAGSEAQWFFDSWVSKCAGVLRRLTGDESYARLQLAFLNRALGQVTADGPVTGADGNAVASFALPESYNALLEGGFAPSPITPLNWAKASLRLALAELRAGLSS